MDNESFGRQSRVKTRALRALTSLMLVGLVSGCYAPLHYYGIPACELDDSFRTPTRQFAARLNFSNLTRTPTADYILGPNDILEITVQSLLEVGDLTPLEYPIGANGEVQLPLAGGVKVAGMTVLEAQQAITRAFEDGLIVNPRVIVKLAQKATIDVVVMGEVTEPGVYALPADKNDVAHAIASARGLTPDAAEIIQVHRRQGTTRRIPGPVPPLPEAPPEGDIQLQGGFSVAQPSATISGARISIASGFEPSKDVLHFDEQRGITGNYDVNTGVLTLAGAASADDYEAALRSVSYENRSEDLFDAARKVTFNVEVITQPYEEDAAAGLAPNPPGNAVGSVLHIPLRGRNPNYVLGPEDVILQPGDEFTDADVTLREGDVVVVQRRSEEIFWVVGELNDESQTRFSVRDRDRELGNGFFLPQDRDIDVVTAVAMAGYIDPIDSPTTVTIQRHGPNQQPMLIVVDLLKARYDRQETVLVQAGDIIYLNPDAHWWFRRTLDRIIPNLITIPYDAFIVRTILGP